MRQCWDFVHALHFLFPLQVSTVGGMAVLLVFTTCSIQVWCANSSSPPKEAYATLLYGDFLVGTRVLGQSIRNTGTNRDYLALCTEGVSETSREVLRNDGWKVIPVKGIENMFSTAKNPSRFTFTITKLQVWMLTDYRRIILIDSDAIVLQNIDHLFLCGDFCAVFRHSDLFNTGVMVIKPSITKYEELMAKTTQLQSYDGADQGFLNSAFSELKYERMFNPKVEKSSMDGTILRLEAGYNMDIGIYYINGHWSMPPDQHYVLHYTLGPLKPWIWWTYPLFDQNWYWHVLRKQLPPSPDDPYAIQLMCIIPIVLTAVLVTLHLRNNRHVTKWRMHPSWFTSVWMKLLYFVAVPVALVGGFLCVPAQLWPLEGYVCFYLWSLLFLTALYLAICNVALRARDQGDLVPKSRNRPHFVMAVSSFFISFSLEFIAASLIPYYIEPLVHRVLAFLTLLVLLLLHSYSQGKKMVMSYVE